MMIQNEGKHTGTLSYNLYFFTSNLWGCILETLKDFCQIKMLLDEKVGELFRFSMR